MRGRRERGLLFQYCAGIIDENENGKKALHLVPLNGFFSMRPSLKHLNNSSGSNAEVDQGIGGDGLTPAASASAPGSHGAAPIPQAPQQVQTNFLKPDTDKSVARKERAYQTLVDDIEREEWIDLDYKDTASNVGAEVISRMISAQNAGDRRADYDVQPYTYLEKISTSQEKFQHSSSVQILREDAKATQLFTFDSLKYMSGDQQLQSVMRHTHAVSFSRLKELCTAFRDETKSLQEAEEALVRSLDKHACFVAGRWLAQSKHVCESSYGISPVFRDAFLVMLARSENENAGVRRSDVCEELCIKSKHVLLLLEPIMRLNRKTGLWEFKIKKDDEFLAKYAGVADRHQSLWTSDNQRTFIMDALKVDMARGLTVAPRHAASHIESSYRPDTRRADNEKDRALYVSGGDTSRSSRDTFAKQSSRANTNDNVGDDNSSCSVEDGEGSSAMDLDDHDNEVGGDPSSISDVKELSELFMDMLEENGVMTVDELVEAICNDATPQENISAALEKAAEMIQVGEKKFCVRRVKPGEPYAKLRKVVIALFDQRGEDGSLKKSEILKGAMAAGLGNIPNQLYLRVLKDVATAHKSIWTWKWGE